MAEIDFFPADFLTNPSTGQFGYKDAAGNFVGLTTAQVAGITSSVVGADGSAPTDSLTMSVLPGYIDGQAQYNCLASDNLIYSNGYYWCAYWDSTRKPILARQLDGASSWSTFDLSTISGNPLATHADDNHNHLSIAISGDGRIHVSGNMHDVALKYVRCSAVASWNSAGAWSAPGMIGAQETSITYPTFIDLRGDLLFTYRNGNSGNGIWYLNRYSQAGGTWSRIATVFGNAGAPSGDGDANAYPSRWVRHSDGSLHVAFTFRTTSLADSNYSVFYMKSTTEGASWTTIDGTALTLPVDATNTSAIAMSTAQTGTGLLNNQNTGLAIDANGSPHITYLKNDGSTLTQIYYIRRSGGAWVNSAVTAFTYLYDLAAGIADGTVSRPDVFCTNGKVYVMSRHNVDRRGYVALLDVTDPSNVRQGRLIDTDLYQWEPSYSGQVFATTGKIMFLPHQCATYFTLSPAIDYQTADRWKFMIGMVVTMTGAQAAQVIAGSCAVPTFRPLLHHSIGESSTAITATVAPGTQIGAGPALTVGQRWRRRGTRIALKVNALARKTVTGTLTLNIRETVAVAATYTSAGANTQAVGLLSVTSGGGPVDVDTPCMGFPSFIQPANMCYFEMYGVSSDAGNATLWHADLTIVECVTAIPAR